MAPARVSVTAPVRFVAVVPLLEISKFKVLPSAPVIVTVFHTVGAATPARIIVLLTVAELIPMLNPPVPKGPLVKAGALGVLEPPRVSVPARRLTPPEKVLVGLSSCRTPA